MEEDGRIVGRCDVEGAFVGSFVCVISKTSDDGGGEEALVVVVVTAIEDMDLKCWLTGRLGGGCAQPATCMKLETMLATAMAARPGHQAHGDRSG